MKFGILFLCILSGCVSKRLDYKYSDRAIQLIRICKQAPSEKSEQPKANIDLVALQKKYLTKESRLANFEVFAKDMDLVAAQAGFGHIVDCKNNLPQQNMTLKIVDGSKNPGASNFLNSEGNILTLNLNANYSVQMALPTYLHELQHICKRKDGRLSEVWKSQGPLFYNRDLVLDEVYATYLMMEAYWKFVNMDPNFCTEKQGTHKDNQKLAQDYAAGMELLEEGRFAQVVLTAYLDTYGKGHYHSAGIFDETSTPQDYTASVYGPAFKMKKLHPLFRKELEKLGIPVVEK